MAKAAGAVLKWGDGRPQADRALGDRAAARRLRRLPEPERRPRHARLPRRPGGGGQGRPDLHGLRLPDQHQGGESPPSSAPTAIPSTRRARAGATPGYRPSSTRRAPGRDFAARSTTLLAARRPASAPAQLGEGAVVGREQHAARNAPRRARPRPGRGRSRPSAPGALGVVEERGDLLGEVERVVLRGVERGLAGRGAALVQVELHDRLLQRHVLEDLVHRGDVVHRGRRVGAHADVGGVEPGGAGRRRTARPVKVKRPRARARATSASITGRCGPKPMIAKCTSARPSPRIRWSAAATSRSRPSCWPITPT